MSRHGKSKSKPRSSKTRADKFVDADLDEAPQRKAKAIASKPPRRVVATETAGALPRENTVRQAPAPEAVRAKAEPAAKPRPAKAELANPEVPSTPVARPEPPRARPEPAPKPQPAKVELAKPEVPAAAAKPSELPPVESAVDILQRSLQAARQGTVEVNRMLLDIGRSNIASGFELARTLAGARTPIEAARLQLAFFDQRMKTLLQQAEALRALSATHIDRANEPIRAHMRLNRIGSWWG